MAGDFSGRLKEVYGAKDNAELAERYGSWAKSYDADVASFGYTYPALVTGLVGRHVSDFNAPLLDAGCGTGLIGVLLAALGYRDLTGIDLSEGMLEVARATGVYRALTREILGEPLGFEDGSFGAVTCIGVLTIGHAPASSLDELVRVTRKGGHVIFTLTRTVLDTCGFKEKIESLADAGRWRQRDVSQEIIAVPGVPENALLMARGYVYQVL